MRAPQSRAKAIGEREERACEPRSRERKTDSEREERAPASSERQRAASARKRAASASEQRAPENEQRAPASSERQRAPQSRATIMNVWRLSPAFPMRLSTSTKAFRRTIPGLTGLSTPRSTNTPSRRRWAFWGPRRRTTSARRSSSARTVMCVSERQVAVQDPPGRVLPHRRRRGLLRAPRRRRDHVLAGGFYSRTRDQTTRYRSAVDDDPAPAPSSVRHHRRKLTKKGFAIGGEHGRTRPRGCPPDHPRLEFMRHESLTASAPAPRPLRPGARPFTVAAMRPLVEWVMTNVGGGTED